MSHFLSPFPELLLLSMTMYSMEYPYTQFRSFVLAVSASKFSCIPSLATGAEWGKALVLGKSLLETAKTLVGYQHCFSHKSKIQHQAGSYEQKYLYPIRSSAAFKMP